MKTVLVKTYPGTGRPNMFEICEDDDIERIELLTESYQYSVVDTGLPDNVDPWSKYTIVDRDGFVQWAS